MKSVFMLICILFSVSTSCISQSIELVNGDFVVMFNFKETQENNSFYFLNYLLLQNKDSALVLQGFDYFDNCNNLIFFPEEKRNYFYALNDKNHSTCDSFSKYKVKDTSQLSLYSCKLVEFKFNKDWIKEVYSSEFYKNKNYDSMVSVCFKVRGEFYKYTDCTFDPFNDVYYHTNELFLKTNVYDGSSFNKYVIPSKIFSFSKLNKHEVKKLNLTKINLKFIQSAEGY